MRDLSHLTGPRWLREIGLRNEVIDHGRSGGAIRLGITPDGEGFDVTLNGVWFGWHVERDGAEQIAERQLARIYPPSRDPRVAALLEAAA